MNQSIQYEIEAVMPTAIASGLFVSLCTIERPDGILVDAGEPSGNFVAVPGCVNIPCTAPPLATRLQANETKTLENIQAFSPLHVLLSGYYPVIQDGVWHGWRAVIDGQPLDILGTESDSQSQMTRMSVRFSGL